MIRIKLLVLFSKNVAHQGAFVYSSNSKVKIHSSVARYNGFYNVGVLESQRIERDLLIIIVADRFNFEKQVIWALTCKTTAQLVEVNLELYHRLPWWSTLAWELWNISACTDNWLFIHIVSDFNFWLIFRSYLVLKVFLDPGVFYGSAPFSWFCLFFDTEADFEPNCKWVYNK